MADDDATQFFCLAGITTWSFEDRTGPEFSQEGRGEYLLEELPLTPQALRGINLKPDEITGVIVSAMPRRADSSRSLNCGLDAALTHRGTERASP